MLLRLKIYTRMCRAERLLANDDNVQRADLRADEVLRAVATSVAVGGSISDSVPADGGSGLVVDGEAELSRLALGEAESVVAGTAGHNFGGQAGDSANLASDVGSVVAGELETSVLDAAVLADKELGDGDVLRVRSLCLRSRCSNSNGGEEGGDSEELHFVWCVGLEVFWCWKIE